jgi:MFS family permease
LRTGIRYARHSPPLKRVLIRSGAFFFFAVASWAFLPLIVRESLGGGAGLFGWMLACAGIGAVAGAVVLPKVHARLAGDGIVAAGTAISAAVALALAYVHDVRLLSISMLVMGAAWLSVMSSLQVAAQMALPAWVRARGLALFLAVFQGAMAVGSVLWGLLAEYVGMSLALALAAAGALAGVLATWRLRIGGHEHADLSPARHWQTPYGSEDLEHDAGPVVVSLEYRIDPATADSFRVAMEALHRIRKRDGAIFWGLFHDAADRSRYIEYFMVESWIEHLRQHERMTVADLAGEARAKAFHVGAEPIVVTHWIAASGQGQAGSGEATQSEVPVIVP